VSDREEYLKAASEALEAEKKKGEPKVVSAGEPEVSLTEAPPAPEKDPEELKGLVAGIKRREMLKRYKDQAEIASWSPNPIMQTAGDIGYLGTSAAQYAEGEVDWTDPAIGAAAVAFPGGIGLLKSMKKKLSTASTKAVKTDMPKFKEWFGGSKVVDDGGKPLVVYHGTTGDFDAFDKKFLSEATGDVDAAEGFYFTSKPKVAGTYAESYGGREFKEARRRGVDINPYTGGTRTITSGANVMPVYLSIENPRVIEFDPEAFFTPLDSNITDMADEFAKARRAGHDGVIFKNVKDDPASNIVSDVYIPFRSEAIKSAVSNTGEYSKATGNILKGAAATVGAGAAGRSLREEESQ
jgi:hypothetical protein